MLDIFLDLVSQIVNKIFRKEYPQSKDFSYYFIKYSLDFIKTTLFSEPGACNCAEYERRRGLEAGAVPELHRVGWVIISSL